MPEGVWSGKHRAACVGALIAIAASLVVQAQARAECAPEPQGEGRVQSVLDARTLMLNDGRIVRLTGLAALRGEAEIAARDALMRIARGRLVSLHGDDDKRDRYGREPRWTFAEGDATSLQEMLIEAGYGIRDIGISDAACREAMESAETKARTAQMGLWAAVRMVKNTESGDDILGEIGHFTLLGGRVLSVRESGGWTYLNFGRRWRDGFAGMVPKSAVAAFEKAGRPLKGFEGQRVRLRGFVVKRGGLRIEITSPEQIETVGPKEAAAVGMRD